MSQSDPAVQELDEFAAGVQLSKLAQTKPDPLTPEYVTQWAHGLSKMAAIGSKLLDDIHEELTPKLRVIATSLGFDQITYMLTAYREELSEMIVEIEDGDADYAALSREYLEAKTAIEAVLYTVKALWIALGNPSPAQIQRLPSGKKLWTVMQGTLQTTAYVNDLGWMLDEMWGPDDAGQVDPPTGDPSEPWYDANPTAPVPVPAGMNALVHALDEAKKLHPDPQAGDVIHVYTEPYDGIGLEFKTKGWTPLIQYDPWWGKALLVLHGTGTDTSIIQPVGDKGWGASWAARYRDGWEGRMHVVGFKIICSGRNGITGGNHGEQEETPLRDMKFVECLLVDGPEVCTRPVTFYQWQCQFVRCRWECAESLEHAVYGHNVLGDCGMKDCTINGVGAQPWQEVSRPHEGPTYPGETTLEDCFFENFHQFAGRAGSAITQAGSGRTFHVKRTVMLDVERQEDHPSGPNAYGAHVTWNGGDENYRPLDGGFANEAVFYEDVDLVFKNPLRSTVALGSVRTASFKRCGIWSVKGISLAPNAGNGELLDSVLVEDCNTPEVRQRVLDRVPGLDESLLIDGPVTFGPDKQTNKTGKKVSDGVQVTGGVLVTA